MSDLRTANERQVGPNIERIFLECLDSVETKLENFPKYVRRQHLKRFLVRYELFKRVLLLKGSIVECGVYRGFGIMSWAKLSAMLEPENLTRRIYGFDTFSGFPSVGEKDRSHVRTAVAGELAADSYSELQSLIREYDADRFLGHVGKVELIRGDLTQTLPEFFASRQHVLVSLLFLDVDLYEPTKVAIEQCLPRMPKGSIIAFDELDNPLWGGETRALLDTLGPGRVRLERFEWDPYVAYATL